jgi:hypothetical protein
MRPLTARQMTALRWVGREFVNGITMRSMPSLIRRGLVVAEKDRHRRLTGHYHLTDAGRAELSSVGGS